MQFTTKTADQPKDLKVKFYFDEDDKSSGVELKFITDEERRDVREKLVKDEIDFVLHPKTSKLTKVVTPVFKTSDLEDWFVDTMISGWWGIFLDTKKVECTKENKIKLYREQKEFTAFVDECFNKINEVAVATYGSSSTEKNSLST